MQGIHLTLDNCGVCINRLQIPIKKEVVDIVFIVGYSKQDAIIRGDKQAKTNSQTVTANADDGITI